LSTICHKKRKAKDQTYVAMLKRIWQLHIYFIAEKIHTAFIRIPGNSIVSQLKTLFLKRIKKLRHESAEKLAKMQLPWQLARTSNAKV